MAYARQNELNGWVHLECDVARVYSEPHSLDGSKIYFPDDFFSDKTLGELITYLKQESGDINLYDLNFFRKDINNLEIFIIRDFVYLADENQAENQVNIELDTIKVKNIKSLKLDDISLLIKEGSTIKLSKLMIDVLFLSVNKKLKNY